MGTCLNLHCLSLFLLCPLFFHSSNTPCYVQAFVRWNSIRVAPEIMISQYLSLNLVVGAISSSQDELPSIFAKFTSFVDSSEPVSINVPSEAHFAVMGQLPLVLPPQLCVCNVAYRLFVLPQTKMKCKD